MIPILCISDLIIAIVAFIIAFYLYRTAHPPRSEKVIAFAKFYLLLGLFFFVNAGPLIISSPYIIGSLDAIGYFFLCFASGQLVYLSLTLGGWPKLGDYAYYAVFIYALFFVIVRLFDLSPSFAEINGNFVYWRPVFAPWLRSLTGFITALIGLVSVSSFLAYGYKNRMEKTIFKSAIWIACGMFLCSVAATLGLMLSPTGTFNMVVAASAFVIVSLLVSLNGITLYRPTDQSQDIFFIKNHNLS